MFQQLSKVYQPGQTEKLAEEIWQRKPFFHPAASADGTDNYSIVIPPPNVTAPLHLGHALNNTLQDILVRFHRMKQCNTLWMPGTDHAGIATQTVVEKRILAKEGKRRTDFERDEFISRVQSWKDEYEARIIEQLKAMGCSCDWQRKRFTMDETCAKAVRAAFFRLFEDELIYRGKRLVNWDPATQTVLADDEVEHETVQGHFWYMKYPLVEPVVIEGEIIEHVTVATTRPETMLGDTAVAMNPADSRAGKLLGGKVRLPIVGRLIPIIADEHVVLPDADSEDEKARFSTGFLKVTPAHDPDDWEIGLRHNLEVINVLAPDGTVSDRFGWSDAGEDAQFLLGMDRFEAREAIVEWFRSENLLAGVRQYAHEVGHSYRSHVPIEPYLSDQWYIAVKKPVEHLAEKFGTGFIEGTDVPANSLAGTALKPLLDGRLRFTPQRYAKIYRAWLENLRDWPISRQLWWGHRIPVWWCNECGKTTSGSENPGQCGHCGSNHIVQDEDVLDTWFSSALWPFSTLGWPESTPELKSFYPGNILCTAREIITLWVSRMVMMGQYCVGDIPFGEVYIHAMIQDGQGRKMSKSLGNGIDPLVAIDSHGADAMRFTLAGMATDTQDIRMPVEKMELPDGREANTSQKFDTGRNFCNKLWNASRFAMMNLEKLDTEKFDADKMAVTDRWILSRLAGTVSEVTQLLETYKFSESLSVLYRFFWNDVCDWYLEWLKPRMQDGAQKDTAGCVLAFVLDETLRLLHPFVPFITEGIFQKLNEIVPKRKLNGLAEAPKAGVLAGAHWPSNLEHFVSPEAEEKISAIQAPIRAIRDIRSEYNIPPAKRLKVTAKGGEKMVNLLNRNARLLCQLANLSEFEASRVAERSANAAAAITAEFEIYVEDVIDPQAERERLNKQKQALEKSKQAVDAKLANHNFLQKAKPEVVEQSRERQLRLSEQLRTIENCLQNLPVK